MNDGKGGDPSAQVAPNTRGNVPIAAKAIKVKVNPVFDVINYIQ